MARDPDDDALRWDGDGDSTLAPGWTPVGSPVDVPPPVAEAATGDDSARPTGSNGQSSSVELVLLGVFGGVYLLYAVGWLITVIGLANPATDAVGRFMFVVGMCLAVIAPALWFGVAFAATRERPRRRLIWLLVGAVVLVPLPFVAGVA